jgi:ferrous iron transport protein A
VIFLTALLNVCAYIDIKDFNMNDESDKYNLTELDDGQSGTIISVMGGKNLTKRLADLGLTTGTEIRVIRRTLFSGPVQIEAAGSRLVLGRGLASKITVLLNGGK